MVSRTEVGLTRGTEIVVGGDIVSGIVGEAEVIVGGGVVEVLFFMICNNLFGVVLRSSILK